jgi:multidrug efflux pump subunit AcrA (membrane-fusion protein)
VSATLYRVGDSNPVQKDTEPFARPGVRIEHERPAPDTEPHIIAPLIVSLSDGQRLVARRWSLAGITDDILLGHDLAEAQLIIPFQGVEVGFPVRFERSADGAIWTFAGLNGRQRETLGLFYRNLLVGKMAATNDLITALDTPVDLVPMGETQEEKAAATANSPARKHRALWRVAYYVTLFAVVTWFLVSTAWPYVEGIRLAHARVAATRIELRAPREGYFAAATAEGAMLAAGAVLARIDQPKGEESVAEAERRHALVERRVADARNRLATLDAFRDEVRAMVAQQHSVSGLKRFDAGLSFRAGDFNDQRLQIENQLRIHEVELERAAFELRRLQEATQFRTIQAPTAGFVAAWRVREGQFVRAGDVVAVLEADEARVFRGWLDDRLAGQVRPDMKVQVRLRSNAEARLLQGRVLSVEAGPDPVALDRFGMPSAPDRAGMIVNVAVDGLSPAESRDAMPYNMPAEVTVLRGLLARLLGRSL